MLLWLIGPCLGSCSATGSSARCTRSNPKTWSTPLLRYESGATGVIQASTAFWPGYTERIEIHGTKGTAIISGDKLTTWDVRERFRRARAARARRGIGRIRSHGHFARAVRTPVPRFRRRHPAPDANRFRRAKTATARWRWSISIYDSCRAGTRSDSRLKPCTDDGPRSRFQRQSGPRLRRARPGARIYLDCRFEPARRACRSAPAAAMPAASRPAKIT